MQTTLRMTGVLLISLMIGACGESPEPVAEERNAESSERRHWPLVWLYEPGSCQNTETRVLIENAVNLITWADPEACELASGSWQSWGRELVTPLHLTWVVPLITPTHADQHGAISWQREQQIAFINDRDNLIILDPTSANERQDYGPEWWTPLERFWCEYATRWQTVKQRYGLDIPEEEQKALARMMEECPAPQEEDQ